MRDILLGTEKEGEDKILALQSLWSYYMCVWWCWWGWGVYGEKQNTQKAIRGYAIEEGSGDMERFGQ